jgi:uncharacterized protein with HEPN domain
MIEACEAITRYVDQGRDVFDDDELVRTWIIHHTMIIGEAASRLSRHFQELHDDIPWPSIIAMRNILIHEYFGVDDAAVWHTASVDVPGLALALRRLSGH